MSLLHSQALEHSLPKLSCSQGAAGPHAGTYLATSCSPLVIPPLQQKDDKNLS